MLPQNDADEFPAIFAGAPAGLVAGFREAEGKAEGKAEIEPEGKAEGEPEAESDGAATTDGSAWALDTGSATAVRDDGAHPATAATRDTAPRLNQRARTGAAWRTRAAGST